MATRIVETQKFGHLKIYVCFMNNPWAIEKLVYVVAVSHHWIVALFPSFTFPSKLQQCCVSSQYTFIMFLEDEMNVNFGWNKAVLHVTRIFWASALSQNYKGPRASDLLSPNVFLWWYLKEKIYKNNPHYWTNLRDTLHWQSDRLIIIIETFLID